MIDWPKPSNGFCECDAAAVSEFVAALVAKGVRVWVTMDEAEHLAAIQAGINDMEAGRVLAFEDVDARIRAKLGFRRILPKRGEVACIGSNSPRSCFPPFKRRRVQYFADGLPARLPDLRSVLIDGWHQRWAALRCGDAPPMLRAAASLRMPTLVIRVG